MERTLLTFIIISFPGLLSATCSSPAYSKNAPTPTAPNSGYAKSSTDNRFDVRQDNVGESMSSWAEDYAPSSQRSSSSSSHLEQQEQQLEEFERCENGWCAEDGSCSCNPCWSGPTCQEYVDRFSPRFLAEEPFFIVDSSSAISILPFPSAPSVDSAEGLFPFVNNAAHTSSSSLSPPSSNKEEDSSSVKPNLLDSNLSSNEESKLSNTGGSNAATSAQQSQFAEYSDTSGGNTMRSPPLFRIEAADDDLGLTCQLGQVGPAATCPCATPRYKVIGASTTIPDDRSLASSSSTNHPEETDNNRPLQESSTTFYNSIPETTNLSHFPYSSSSSYASSATKQNGDAGSGARAGKTADNSQARCPSGWAATQCRKLNSIMFFADEETGDVFLRNGYNLQPGRYYFITLQVYALPVNSSGYRPWREQIVATLFVKSTAHSASEPELQPQAPFTGLSLEQQAPGNIRGLDKSSSETGETQEAGTIGDAYKDEEETYTKDETFDKDNNSSSDNEEDSRETEIARRTGIGEEQKENDNYKKKGKGSAAGDDIDVQSRPTNSRFNYNDKLEDRRKIGSITNKNNSEEIGGSRKQKQQHKQESGDVWENVAESTENSGGDGDENNSNEDEDAVEDEDKRRRAISSSSSFSSSYSHPFQNYHKTASTKKQTNNNKLSNNNGAHNVITMSNAKNKLPYALRADRPHFKYPVNYPALDFVGSGDSLFDTMIPDDEFPSERKKREVPDKSPFKMSISRINLDGANTTTVLPLGVLTKLRLEIQVASDLKPKNFTLEIRTMRAPETNIRFVILSAYVISIGSDISFDKGSTNLAPVMMPWNNSTVYESVIWKWKSVKCGKEGDEPQPSSPLATRQESQTSSPSPPTQLSQQHRSNKEISIEFEVVAVNPKDGGGGNVVNRWMSSVGTPASAVPSLRKQHETLKSPLLADKNLDSGDSQRGTFTDSVGPLSSVHSRGEVNDNDIEKDASEDATLKADSSSPLLPRTIMGNPFRKAGKQFHVTLVPVSARISSYPTGQPQQQQQHKQHDRNSDDTERKVKLGIDKGDDGAETIGYHFGGDDDDDGKSIIKSGGDDNHFYQPLKSYNPTATSDDEDNEKSESTTVRTRIMLPVKYSPGAGNRDISQNSPNQPFETTKFTDTNRKSSLKSIRNKGFKDGRNNGASADGVDLVLEGPTEIPQGGWVSYKMKVYLNHSCQFQLRLEPLQGNEIQYQDTVSVGDIRIVDIGKQFSACSKIPKKGGFRVTCRKLNGRKGDYCTVESPVMRYCSTPSSTKEASKTLHGGGAREGGKVDETSSIGSTERNSNQTQNDGFDEKWNKIVRKQPDHQHHPNRKIDGTEKSGNMLQFEGIIYGFPGSAPGSQFALRAHVHVESIDDNKDNGGGNKIGIKDGSGFSETTLSTDGQVKMKKNGDDGDEDGSSALFSLDEEKTLSGKIVHRKQRTRGPLGGSSFDPSSSSTDFPDGKIPVMREFPAYHYRKRRNVFFEHMTMSHTSQQKSTTNNNNPSNKSDENANNTGASPKSGTSNNPSLSPLPSSSSNKSDSSHHDYHHHQLTKLGESREKRSFETGTSAKTKASSHVKLNSHRRRRRRSPIIATMEQSPADTQTTRTKNTGNLSESPSNLHRFTTWDNFVQITERQLAVHSSRKRKSKRSSPWANLL